MTTKLTVVCAIVAALLAVLTGTIATGSTAASADATAKPIVTVVRQGGLCLREVGGGGFICRSMLRITDKTISAAGFVPRRLEPSERRALLSAVRSLNLASIRAHPFEGMCPMALDGQESIYRFRGFAQPLASCTYELRRVQAVKLTERLLATLKRP